MDPKFLIRFGLALAVLASYGVKALSVPLSGTLDQWIFLVILALALAGLGSTLGRAWVVEGKDGVRASLADWDGLIEKLKTDARYRQYRVVDTIGFLFVVLVLGFLLIRQQGLI